MSIQRLSLTGALLAAVGVLSACVSTAGIHAPASGEPMRVTLYMYAQEQKFGLANPAHTDPVELYSKSRGAASLKIADDEVLLDIIDYLGENGFDEREKIGKAPMGGAYTLAFEVETANGTSHWGTNQKTSSREELIAMNQCVRYYVNEKYNQVQAYQATENTQGGAFFKGVEQ